MVPPSAVSNKPLVGCVGARKRTLLVTKQLAFEQPLGQRGAVEGDEGMARTAAALVDGARDQLLARPALARDQHRRVGGRDVCDLLVDFEHGRTGPDQDLVPGDGGAKRTVLLGQAPPLQGPRHGCTNATMSTGLAR